MRSALLAAATFLILPACTSGAGAEAVSASAEPAPASTVASPDEAGSARLHQLFRDSDEASLRRNPLSAIFRGDLRYADRFGDYVSDAY